MEKLLERILQSKYKSILFRDITKKRKGKLPISAKNDPISLSNFDAKNHLDNKIFEDLKSETFHELPKQEPRKFQFNINFDNE